MPISEEKERKERKGERGKDFTCYGNTETNVTKKRKKERKKQQRYKEKQRKRRRSIFKMFHHGYAWFLHCMKQQKRALQTAFIFA